MMKTQSPFIHRFGRCSVLLFLALLTLLVSAILRVALVWQSTLTLTPFAWLQIFSVGAIYDIIIIGYFCFPLAFIFALTTNRLASTRIFRVLTLVALFIAIFGLCLVSLAEWYFWEEFGTRFNFIAVDYLIYTTEVLGNIWESYPVPALLGLTAGVSLLVWGCAVRLLGNVLSCPVDSRMRIGAVLAMGVIPSLGYTALSTESKRLSSNETVNDLSGNGIYELFAANYNNELDFERFYRKLPLREAMATVRKLLAAEGSRWQDAHVGGLRREVEGHGPQRRLNVILVSVESLGSEFLGRFGNPEGLTPNIDDLAKYSLTFTNLFSTGNRTVRGLEALSLGIPPTPGQSIVKRPHNEGLFSLGAILRKNGYDSKFLYGGYSYFDNMSYFFEQNAYRVVDRSALATTEIHYENIWGVADEDLYSLALREMSYASDGLGHGAAMFLHVMTTSNHRPYSYPAGRIDIPSGSGRAGAVKYTDWALGDFLRRAKQEPWFNNTLFIITADHGASARGVSIPIDKYRIPLIIYSPGHVEPGQINELMSQIDIPPTLLGLLNLHYTTKFFGYDVLHVPHPAPRAFVANYQMLGYMRAGRMVTLQPGGGIAVANLASDLAFASDGEKVSDEELQREAVSYYQVAAYAYKHGHYSFDSSD